MPRSVAAVLAALHFRDPQEKQLASLIGRERDEALAYADKQSITLFLSGALPEETAVRAEKNGARLGMAEAGYRKLAALPFDLVALKGLTHCELFGVRPEDRPQYDIDLYLPRETVEQARDALLTQGYETIGGMERFPTDHLPGLFPRTDWRWRGDYFDPEMPLAVELHFRFWNPSLERLEAPGVEEFWARRVRGTIGGVEMATLSPQDAAAYAAMHLVKHLLRGSGRVLHVYEIARFLETRASQAEFWNEWRRLHSPPLRRLQSIAFLLAESWFGCALPPAIREEAERLPARARAWFEEFATAPAEQPFRPNKDELWLHLSLLDSWSDKRSVAWRRLLPKNLPPPSRATETESKRKVYAAWVASRLRHHAISLWSTAASGLRLWRRARGIEPRQRR